MKKIVKKILMLFLFTLGIQFSQAQVPVGSMAPAFSLPDTSGKIVTLNDFSGSVVLLNFFYHMVRAL